MATVLLGLMSFICISIIYRYENKIGQSYAEYRDAKKTAEHYKRTYELSQERIKMYSMDRIDSQEAIRRLDEANQTLINHIDKLKLEISELKNQVYTGFKNGGTV